MHPYPRLFTRANARLQRSLSAEARLDLTVLAFYVQCLADDEEYPCVEDIVYLAEYGLITWNPN